MFKACQRGMENLRQQMREARQAGALPAGLPPVAPPGYNKLGSAAFSGGGDMLPAGPVGPGMVRTSARASARNAAAALAAAAAAAGNEDDDGLDNSDRDYSAGSDWFTAAASASGGRGSGGRGRGRRGGGSGGRGSRGGGRGSRGGRGGRGRGRSSGYTTSSGGFGGFGSLDDLDALDLEFADTGRVKMMCPARMGGTGARRERNNNKHKRLFLGGEGALQDGQPLFYRNGQDGALLRSGIAVINPDGVSGIKCDCCDQVRVLLLVLAVVEGGGALRE